MENKVLVKIGKKVKDLRIRNRMTQKELAKSLGYKQSFISKLEHGLSNIRISNFMMLCRKLKVKFEILEEVPHDTAIHNEKSESSQN